MPLSSHTEQVNVIHLMTTEVYWALPCSFKLWRTKRNREGQLKREASFKKKKRIKKQEQKEIEGKFERNGVEQFKAGWNKKKGLGPQNRTTSKTLAGIPNVKCLWNPLTVCAPHTLLSLTLLIQEQSVVLIKRFQLGWWIIWMSSS